jgi:hypothetical protein
MPEHKVAEVTVRLYVREHKRELGWSTRATCVPQSYTPGHVTSYRVSFCASKTPFPRSPSKQNRRPLMK